MSRADGDTLRGVTTGRRGEDVAICSHREASGAARPAHAWVLGFGLQDGRQEMPRDTVNEVLGVQRDKAGHMEGKAGPRDGSRVAEGQAAVLSGLVQAPLLPAEKLGDLSSGGPQSLVVKFPRFLLKSGNKAFH